MKRLYTLLVLLIPYFVYAQDCTQKLRLAQATYDQGRLHEVEALIKPCLGTGELNKQQKVDGYKLLVLSFIYLEEPEQADESMLSLLREDPYFKPNQTDPAEFHALYKTFRTNPIYRIGAGVGVNFSQPNVTESVVAVNLASGSKYSPLVGIQVGAVGEVPITKNFTASGKLLYAQHRFGIDLIVDRGADNNGAATRNEFKGTETQNWLSLPIAVQYQLAEKKYNPYVSLGVSIDYLLNAEITGERLRTNETSIEEKTYDLKLQREKINLSAIACAGTKIRVGGGYLISEVQFLYGITNINSNETSFNNQQIALDAGYADPVFKLVSAGIVVGYVQNIFNPKKLTRKK